jgi:hypothetical protein
MKNDQAYLADDPLLDQTNVRCSKANSQRALREMLPQMLPT